MFGLLVRGFCNSRFYLPTSEKIEAQSYASSLACSLTPAVASFSSNERGVRERAFRMRFSFLPNLPLPLPIAWRLFAFLVPLFIALCVCWFASPVAHTSGFSFEGEASGVGYFGVNYSTLGRLFP